MKLLLFPLVTGAGFLVFVYIRNESARTLYIKTDPAKAFCALRINSSDDVDEKDLIDRNLLLDTIWNTYFDKIHPLHRNMHLLSEHDLSSWLNFYLLFRGNETDDWMKEMGENVKNAENGIENICNFFSENCTIRFG